MENKGETERPSRRTDSDSVLNFVVKSGSAQALALGGVSPQRCFSRDGKAGSSNSSEKSCSFSRSLLRAPGVAVPWSCWTVCLMKSVRAGTDVRALPRAASWTACFWCTHIRKGTFPSSYPESLTVTRLKGRNKQTQPSPGAVMTPRLVTLESNTPHCPQEEE